MNNRSNVSVSRLRSYYILDYFNYSKSQYNSFKNSSLSVTPTTRFLYISQYKYSKKNIVYLQYNIALFYVHGWDEYLKYEIYNAKMENLVVFLFDQPRRKQLFRYSTAYNNNQLYIMYL